MVKIAVAGGLGNIGRTIVETLKETSRHEVIVLSRKAVDDDLAPIIAVDYTNVQSLTKTLQDNSVQVVISAILVIEEIAAQSQNNLVNAAAKSSTTKRFVASEYGFPYGPEYTALEELKKTDLEWTRFQCGYFLDYYGLPHIKSYQPEFAVVLDIPHKVAAIPGDGNTPVAFTYTYDVAKFVVAALDLPKWDTEYYIIGDKLTWNEFLKLAEEACGSKFEVHYDGIEKLKSFQCTELPLHKQSYSSIPREHALRLFSMYSLLMATGRYDLPYEKSLNELFPEIKTLGAKQMLEQTWKGK